MIVRCVPVPAGLAEEGLDVEEEVACLAEWMYASHATLRTASHGERGGTIAIDFGYDAAYGVQAANYDEFCFTRGAASGVPLTAAQLDQFASPGADSLDDEPLVYHPRPRLRAPSRDGRHGGRDRLSSAFVRRCAEVAAAEVAATVEVVAAPSATPAECSLYGTRWTTGRLSLYPPGSSLVRHTDGVKNEPGSCAAVLRFAWGGPSGQEAGGVAGDGLVVGGGGVAGDGLVVGGGGDGPEVTMEGGAGRLLADGGVLCGAGTLTLADLGALPHEVRPSTGWHLSVAFSQQAAAMRCGRLHAVPGVAVLSRAEARGRGLLAAGRADRGVGVPRGLSAYVEADWDVGRLPALPGTSEHRDSQVKYRSAGSSRNAFVSQAVVVSSIGRVDPACGWRDCRRQGNFSGHPDHPSLRACSQHQLSGMIHRCSPHRAKRQCIRE